MNHSKKWIGEEVEALYLNGPSAGGGARKKVSESIGVLSTFIEREKVSPQVHLKEWKREEEGGEDN
ncbi:hypothetical protein [Virgibacillus ainsalahensis]